MTNIKKYIYPIIIIILLLVVVLQRSCNRPNEIRKVEVVIPEKVIEIQKETEIKYLPSKPQKIYVEGKEIKTENPVNEKLVRDYILTKDSLKLEKYVKAIEEKEQIRTFNKDGVKVDVKTKTRGELLEQSVITIIEEQKIKVDVPIKTRTSVYVGAGLSNNKDLTNFTVQAELGLQIKRDIISITVNSEKTFGIKYLIKL